MANLASTYWNQGRWTEAEKMHVQVMETRQRLLGEEHPDTMTSMANLASTYWNQGQWMEAEKMEKTQEVHRKSKQAEHTVRSTRSPMSVELVQEYGIDRSIDDGGRTRQPAPNAYRSPELPEKTCCCFNIPDATIGLLTTLRTSHGIQNV
jgi:hypothetical protein